MEPKEKWAEKTPKSKKKWSLKKTGEKNTPKKYNGFLGFKLIVLIIIVKKGRPNGRLLVLL